MSEHRTITLYRWADVCAHPEPDDDEDDATESVSEEWTDWDAEHPYGDEDERICLLSPLPGRCEACSDEAGEDVPCRVEQVSQP